VQSFFRLLFAVEHMKIKGWMTGLPEDWIPIRRAPFCFNRFRLLPNVESWIESLKARVIDWGDTIERLDQFEWSASDRGHALILSTASVISVINAETGYARINSLRERVYRPPSDLDIGKALTWVRKNLEEEGAYISVSATFDKFTSLTLNSIVRGVMFDVDEVRLHFRVLKLALNLTQSDFEAALRLGRAVIMARKHSPLAPFEPILPDQWSCFVMDEPVRDGFRRGGVWWSRLSSPSERICTASGPGGEKLYSVCVAPGETAESATGTDEDRCGQHVLRLMKEHPDRAPKSRDDLFGDALLKWPDLSRRAFDRACDLAEGLSGVSSWFKNGRPPGSSTKNLRTKPLQKK
jgi:hypothetical protein